MKWTDFEHRPLVTKEQIREFRTVYDHPECTKTNNSEQIVGQDSKATQDAQITAPINYKPK